MGRAFSSLFSEPSLYIHVTTGDKKGAGTDANVWITIHDDCGTAVEDIKLDRLLVNDHERGETYTYSVSGVEKFGHVEKITLWRDSSGLGDAWFVDRVEVQHTKLHNARYVFPVQRWVKPNLKYVFYQYDTFLPQEDQQKDRRELELAEKRLIYKYTANFNDGPLQVSELPDDEAFSEKYFLDFLKLRTKLMAQMFFLSWSRDNWSSFDDMKNVYLNQSKLYMPDSVDHWNDDKWFGLMKVQGVNPVLIQLCTDIPAKFRVDPEALEPLLEKKSLDKALTMNRIFMTDLEILEGINCRNDNVLVIPMCLFYLNDDDELLPIAIQLYQDKPEDVNPVYYPTDHKYTWAMAKMFYHMAEAQHHQSVTHLGLTHIVMEGFVVCTHRNLSPSHPIFKLVAPHFLYLIAINTRGLQKLVSPNGWVDRNMTVGVKGMFELIAKGFRRWKLQDYGIIERQVAARGVLDKNILPYYPYRDDAIDLYNITRRYVSKVVKYYYDTPEKIKNDHELQNWRREMAISQKDGGLGAQDVPGTDDGFTDVEQIIDTATVLISTCSQGHAAANFQQYDSYGYVPNYPGILYGLPPDKKRDMTMEELLAFLPNKETTLEIMVITKLLSMKGTNSLGDFEVQYLYDPAAVLAADEYRAELRNFSLEVERRNKTRVRKYDWLDPKQVPNAISI